MKRLTFNITNEQHKKIKIYAFKHDISVAQILRDHILDLLYIDEQIEKDKQEK